MFVGEAIILFLALGAMMGAVIAREHIQDL